MFFFFFFRVVSWRHHKRKRTVSSAVTNLSTAVGHYTNNSYMCTLELLIYMSSPLHRHTLKRPRFGIGTTVCVRLSAAARPWSVICLWWALTHAWGSPTAGVPTGALGVGGSPRLQNLQDVLQRSSTSINIIPCVRVFKCVWHCETHFETCHQHHDKLLCLWRRWIHDDGFI